MGMTSKGGGKLIISCQETKHEGIPLLAPKVSSVKQDGKAIKKKKKKKFFLELLKVFIYISAATEVY